MPQKQLLYAKNKPSFHLYFFLFISCSEDRLLKSKYDVTYNIKNATNQPVDLFFREVMNTIKWEKLNLQPNETFQIKFNIIRDIKISEGGFIFEAVFTNGKTIDKNTGYFTNYVSFEQMPVYLEITDTEIVKKD